MKIFNTSVGLSDKQKAKVIDLLWVSGATFIDLALNIKQAHWSTRGSNFIGFHELLDECRSTVDDWSDTLQEYIAQLGGTQKTTKSSIQELSILHPMDENIGIVDLLARSLGMQYASTIELVRQQIDQTTDIGDTLAANILTDTGNAFMSNQWKIMAHIRSDLPEINVNLTNKETKDIPELEN